MASLTDSEAFWLKVVNLM
uniref:Uncharacterized protein n=1 Tax=Arundo donax TaxID=35708 RepID=A0A0A9F3J7_ARUDO